MDTVQEIKGSPSSPFIVGTVVVSFLSWFAYYKLVNIILPSRTILWNFNIAATTHALLLTSMSLICMVFYNPPLLTKLCDASQTPATLVVSICLGYFLYDTSWCLLYWAEHKNVMNVIHHVVTIVIISIVLFSGFAAEGATNVIFATEISTPFFMFRWFLKESQMKETVLYDLNDYIFFSAYMIFRILIGTWYAWNLISYPGCPPIANKFSLLAIYAVSWVWVPSLCKMFFYKIKKCGSSGGSLDIDSGTSQADTKIPSVV